MHCHWTFALAALLCISAHAKLTVHLVPHTHDDVGWLKTVDEYFSGANNSIQHAAVRNILNSVTSSLELDPARKFTYVEQAFFQRWYRELSYKRRQAIKQMVARGQLNFVNGGWCATSSHPSICSICSPWKLPSHGSPLSYGRSSSSRLLLLLLTAAAAPLPPPHGCCCSSSSRLVLLLTAGVAPPHGWCCCSSCCS